MKFGTNVVNINPDQPVKQAGFIQQVEAISEVHDDLHARIMMIEGDELIIMVSVDSLGGSLEYQQKIESTLKEKLQRNLHLIISSTHTHFAPDLKDVHYQEFLAEKIVSAVLTTELKEYNELEYSYQYAPYQEIGKSRISGQETDLVFIELVRIYDKDSCLANLMIYNCHPTVMSGNTPFFSAEYPGYAIGKLKLEYPQEFFTFMQGASGDVSTRFTRSSQEYSAVAELGDKFCQRIEEFRAEKPEHKKIELSYTEETMPIVHEVIDLEKLDIPANLTDREKETIEYGKIAREKLLADMSQLPKFVLFSRVSFGDYSMIFSPSELFSYYLKAIDKKKASLICYSNGYSRYVTGMEGQRITYELFTDTFSMETKQRMFDIFKKMGS